MHKYIIKCISVEIVIKMKPFLCIDSSLIWSFDIKSNMRTDTNFMCSGSSLFCERLYLTIPCFPLNQLLLVQFEFITIDKYILDFVSNEKVISSRKCISIFFPFDANHLTALSRLSSLKFFVLTMTLLMISGLL